MTFCIWLSKWKMSLIDLLLFYLLFFLRWFLVCVFLESRCVCMLPMLCVYLCTAWVSPACCMCVSYTGTGGDLGVTWKDDASSASSTSGRALPPLPGHPPLPPISHGNQAPAGTGMNYPTGGLQDKTYTQLTPIGEASREHTQAYLHPQKHGRWLCLQGRVNWCRNWK